MTEDKAVRGPKALFYYLALFFTLGITAFAVGTIWYQFINTWFPLEISYGVSAPFSQAALKFQIASLLWGTPIFFLFSVLLRRALNKGTLDPNNRVRLWVTHIILFIVLVIALGDLIATTYALLNGDYTARFLLKSLTILLITGWISTYYVLELRAQDYLIKNRLPKIFAGVTIAVIVASLVGSFFLLDSPAASRRAAFDQTRESNLQNISSAISDYYATEEKLPASLSDINVYGSSITDPKTKQPYDYRAIDATSYELCATFESSNKDRDTKGETSYYGYTDFTHDAGYQCFKQTLKTINNDITPGRPVPVPVQ